MADPERLTREERDATYHAVQTLDLRAILESQGYSLRRDGFFVENPLRSEKTSSIHVRTDAPSRWHDFGSGDGGDLIDFLEAAENLDKESATIRAAELLGTRNGSSARARPRPSTPPGDASLKPNTAKAEPVETFDDVVDQAHEALFLGDSPDAARAWEYLKQRGISPATAKAARLGVVDDSVSLPESMTRGVFSGRILFPYLDRAGQAVFLNARSAADVDDDYRFRKPRDARQIVPYNAPSLARAAGYVIVVEGELDALSLLEALGPDAPVIGTGGGGWRDAFLANLPGDLEHAFLLFDADDAGERFAEAATPALEARGITAKALVLPDACKDANDALRAAGADGLRHHVERQIDAARSISDASYLLTTYLEELDRRHARPHAAYTTTLDQVDRLLDGGYHEGLHVVGGITGGGKTSYALRVSLENALAGRHVIYASYEQSKLELWSRLASAVTTLPYSALKRGTYHERDGSTAPAGTLIQQHEAWSTLLKASERLVILEAGDALSRRDSEHTVEALQRLARRLKADTGVPPLIVVDYLQRVPAKDLTGRDIRERVAYVAGLLQVGLAREVGSPVLALSSLNRASYQQGGKLSPEQRLSSLKESGELEYSAYTVTLLYGVPEGQEDEGFTPGALDKWKPMVLGLVKNREGAIGDTPVRWTPVGDQWTDVPAKTRW